MKKYKVGYTAGTFDMFHIGHLNVLRNAKSICDFLIVAVSTDELVKDYKHHETVIPFEDRVKIVEAIKYVDKVVPQTSMNKLQAAKDNNIDVMIVGDDWKGTDKWNQYEQQLKGIGVTVEYMPHTDGISSTMLREKMKL